MAAQLDGSRWLWVEAQCSDGSVDLAAIGLDRELSLSVRRAGLLLTHETSLPVPGCTMTEMWLALPAPGGHFRFEPQARVAAPAGQRCGPALGETVDGSLRLSGDVLEVVTTRSPWCRGFDARFTYRRVAPRRADGRQLVTAYFGHYNRRDPVAVAGLFSDVGSLVEPFSATEDGNYRRHEGRAAIAAWYASAFDSASWMAMRVLDIDTTDASGQVIASWEYMDEHLASPLRGRNIFVLAGGEIFETEVQLESDPHPKGEQPEDTDPKGEQPEDTDPKGEQPEDTEPTQ